VRNDFFFFFSISRCSFTSGVHFCALSRYPPRALCIGRTKKRIQLYITELFVVESWHRASLASPFRMFYLRQSALFSNRMHKVRRNNSACRCTRFAVIKQLSGFNAATLLSIYYLTRFANTHSTSETNSESAANLENWFFSASPCFESPANDDAIFAQWRYYSRPLDTSANRRDYRARFWLAARHRATP